MSAPAAVSGAQCGTLTGRGGLVAGRNGSRLLRLRKTPHRSSVTVEAKRKNRSTGARSQPEGTEVRNRPSSGWDPHPATNGKHHPHGIDQSGALLDGI